MNKPLHERLAALHEYLSPPSANALTPPALELLEEAIRALTPPKSGERAPTLVEMPWPTLSAGMRIVTGAYARGQVADYGNARAAERDAYWRIVLAEQAPKLPALDEDMSAILGRPNFGCIQLAEILRKGGHQIARKAEAEQAAVIHWTLGLYLAHGEHWKAAASSDMDRMMGKVDEEAQANLLPPAESFVITGVEVKSA